MKMLTNLLLLLRFRLPTDVQAEAIPLILGGGDVLMAAETGSGKTGAFCLPLLQVVWESLKDLEQARKGGGGGESKQVEGAIRELRSVRGN
jgi:superfamily II DNA/RNA helicase